MRKATPARRPVRPVAPAREPASPWVAGMEVEIDAELFDGTGEQLTLAGGHRGLEPDPEDCEPWQHLGDVLGELTGELEVD